MIAATASSVDQSSGREIERLTGRELADGWIVGEILARGKHSSGGCFSVGYSVSCPDGRLGFLKALDFSSALEDPVALESMLSGYNFECDLLKACKEAKLSRVVLPLGYGTIDAPSEPLRKIYYILLERADGNIRDRLVTMNSPDFGWCFGVLRHAALGLHQLHGRNIFHQDVKPSNVLIFESLMCAKLADFGRSHCGALKAPHEGYQVPGALSYAPPEQLYDFQLVDRTEARRAADLYLLGSLLYFFFCGYPLTAQTVEHLKVEHWPHIVAKQPVFWSGQFNDVLPYYRDAYRIVIDDFEHHTHAALRDFGADGCKDDVCAILKMMTEPDPRQRGHYADRRAKNMSDYGLQRFISFFVRMEQTLNMKKKINAKRAA